jgi:hypothetical protein
MAFARKYLPAELSKSIEFGPLTELIIIVMTNSQEETVLLKNKNHTQACQTGQRVAGSTKKPTKRQLQESQAFSEYWKEEQVTTAPVTAEETTGQASFH